MSYKESAENIEEHPEGGYSKSLFVEEVSDELCCAICFEVLRDPHQCPNGHMFCHSCITMSLARKSECPSCNEKLDKGTGLSKCLFVKLMIEKLIVKCDTFVDQGPDNCLWIGPMHERAKHMLQCEKRTIPCPGCGLDCIADKLSFHLEFACLKRQVTCKCGLTYVYDQIEKHNMQCLFVKVECPLYVISCCVQSCTGTVTRKSLQAHLSFAGHSGSVIAKLLERVKQEEAKVAGLQEVNNMLLDENEQLSQLHQKNSSMPSQAAATVPSPSSVGALTPLDVSHAQQQQQQVSTTTRRNNAASRNTQVLNLPPIQTLSPAVRLVASAFDALSVSSEPEGEAQEHEQEQQEEEWETQPVPVINRSLLGSSSSLNATEAVQRSAPDSNEASVDSSSWHRSLADLNSPAAGSATSSFSASAANQKETQQTAGSKQEQQQAKKLAKKARKAAAAEEKKVAQQLQESENKKATVDTTADSARDSSSSSSSGQKPSEAPGSRSQPTASSSSQPTFQPNKIFPGFKAANINKTAAPPPTQPPASKPAAKPPVKLAQQLPSGVQMYTIDSSSSPVLRDLLKKATGSAQEQEGRYEEVTYTSGLYSGATYSGGVRAGKRHGFGTVKLASGVKYMGDWKEDKKHGKGCLTFVDGSSYQGEWRDDLMSGHMVRTFKDGRTVTEVWEHDKFCGFAF